MSDHKEKSLRITNFFSTKRDTLGLKIVKLVAIDGFTFNQIAKSETLSTAMHSLGYKLPRTPTRIKCYILEQYEIEKCKVVEKIKNLREKNIRFSISFDESTSLRNRRYLNLNLHMPDGFQTLGLIRIKGSCNSKKTIQEIENRLREFGLSFENDIIASITDGSSLNLKFGKETKPIHITCMAHAIHLCVIDIFVKKQNEKGLII